MSQVEAFNDNVTEVVATQPSMAMAIARSHSRAADPAEAEHDETRIKTGARTGRTTDSGWPQWPNAWPDGSRRS
jgi:hypothetical protein